MKNLAFFPLNTHGGPNLYVPTYPGDYCTAKYRKSTYSLVQQSQARALVGTFLVAQTEVPYQRK
jgi:hypothetical protein